MASNRVETLTLKINGQEVLNNQKDLQLLLRASKKELNELTDGTEEYILKAQEINQISEHLDNVKTKNKEVANEWKKQGNEYKSGIKERVDGLTLFGVSIGDVKGKASNLFQTFTSGAKISKLLSAAMYAIPIFLLIGAFTTLTGWLTKNQEGMNFLSKASRVFSDLLNLLLQRAIAFGKASFKIFKGLAKILTDPLNPTEGLKLMKEGFEDTTKAVNDLGSAIKQTFNNAVEFVNLEVQFRRLNRQSELMAAQLAANAEKLNAIADDATKSFAEQERAQRLARIEQEKAFQEELKIAERKATLVNKEIAQAKLAGDVTDDLLDKQKDAQIELIRLRGEEQIAFLESEKKRREIILARTQLNLDIEIDGFDVVKSINERIIANDKLTATERKAIIEETDQLRQESFLKQIALIQATTDAQINAEKLVAESNSTLLQQQIRALGLAEEMETRLLEVIKEQRIARQDIAEAQKEINEKAQQEALEAIDRQFAEELQKEKESLLAKQLTKEQFQENADELELTRLIARKEMMQKIGLETFDIENEILDKELELLDKRITAEEAAAKKLADIDAKRLEASKAKMEALGNETASLIENAKTIEDVTKGLFNLVRREIKAALAAAVANAIKGAITKSGNPLIGLALAPIAAAGVNTLFDKLVPSFNTGGETGFGDLGLGRNKGGFIRGTVEEGEFVIPKGLRSDPNIANLTGYVENRIRGINTTPPPVINNQVSSTLDINSAGDLKEAGMMMLQAATVLANTRLQSELTIENVRNIKEVTDRDDQRKEENRARGSLR